VEIVVRDGSCLFRWCRFSVGGRQTIHRDLWGYSNNYAVDLQAVFNCRKHISIVDSVHVWGVQWGRDLRKL
jgi:hypothetical protein